MTRSDSNDSSTGEVLSAGEARLKQEITAGVTTFITMAYIIIVNPKILEASGMPFGASMKSRDCGYWQDYHFCS